MNNVGAMDPDDSKFAVPFLPNGAQQAGNVAATSFEPINAVASTSAVTFAHPMAPAPLRRRRFSTAKIQPTRIKKVMQSDEDIGRMVASVPVSIGRAMEHFAEKFLQAAAEATQCSNSKTLTPQHMKQAMLATPYFCFLEPLLKEIPLAPSAVDAAMVKFHSNVREQQNLAELKAAAAQMSPMCSPVLGPPPPWIPNHFQPMVYGNPGMNGVADPQSFSPIFYPPSDEALKNMQLASPTEPNGYTQEVSAPSKRANGKRVSTDVCPETEPTEKPKRGRPKKKKPEKCIDEALFVEATSKIEKEDKDRELMPPPALPFAVPALPVKK
ncbi:unnamed protein product [Caenorhabditis auriculariae]|uniref:Transcription factor CBF/NF-Y/archaeal histone domain-containing protein n=1 Tax=Caenorhabditis auriculariae TaxID=2777116 RepID=A0A8S1HH13_9PELO|nr:unnamed protein product [Caenorhabditis auriculariae]